MVTIRDIIEGCLPESAQEQGLVFPIRRLTPGTTIVVGKALSELNDDFSLKFAMVSVATKKAAPHM